jgi:hypothetical protein
MHAFQASVSLRSASGSDGFSEVLSQHQGIDNPVI